MQIRMEHRWHDTDKEEVTYRAENLSQCQFEHSRCHMDWPGTGRGPPW